MKIDLHPLCSLFPRMVGAEFDALVADIKANGQREPIIMHDGMILDGGNRYLACIEAGIKPQTMKYGGGNIVSYVLSANLHRRHLSTGQHAAIVASCQNWDEAQPHGGDRKSDQSAILHLDSAKDRAAVSGASLRTQKSADKVAKSDPELAKGVAHGEISLPKALAKVSKKDTPSANPKNPTIPKKAVQEFGIDYTEIDSLRESLRAETVKSETLLNHLAVKVWNGTEDQKAELLGRLDVLVADVNRLERELHTMTVSRDAEMAKSAALTKSNVAMANRLKALSKAEVKNGK